MITAMPLAAALISSRRRTSVLNSTESSRQMPVLAWMANRISRLEWIFRESRISTHTSFAIIVANWGLVMTMHYSSGSTALQPCLYVPHEGPAFLYGGEFGHRPVDGALGVVAQLTIPPVIDVPQTHDRLGQLEQHPLVRVMPGRGGCLATVMAGQYLPVMCLGRLRMAGDHLADQLRLRLHHLGDGFPARSGRCVRPALAGQLAGEVAQVGALLVRLEQSFDHRLVDRQL